MLIGGDTEEQQNKLGRIFQSLSLELRNLFQQHATINKLFHSQLESTNNRQDMNRSYLESSQILNPHQIQQTQLEFLDETIPIRSLCALLKNGQLLGFEHEKMKLITYIERYFDKEEAFSYADQQAKDKSSSQVNVSKSGKDS